MLGYLAARNKVKCPRLIDSGTHRMIDISTINDWHAHVYFDAQTVEQARTLCEEAERRFELKMGRVHEKPVGPHPCWSCQLAFQPDQFDTLVPWLSLNRGGMTVLVHPQTGNDLADHKDRAMWLGRSAELDLSIFERSSG